MPANFSRYFVEAPGNTVLADHWNGEFNNILSNFDPDGMDDASVNLAAMQATADPGELSTESLATALRGEIQRLRFAVQEAKYGSNTAPKWYESPSAVNTRPAIHLDNTATDGGSLYFNAGTSQFLQCSADGTKLRAGGALLIAEGLDSNLGLARATTTNADDSVKITSSTGAALSATNPATIVLPGSSGTSVVFTITADVTILLTGAHWGIGGKGDANAALLRILAINDNGTLKWGVAYLGGRNTMLTTDTTATNASVTLPEQILCKPSAISSSTNFSKEIGFIRCNFDDTGGAAEDLWAIRSLPNEVVYGRTADGNWQPWIFAFTGFSVNPTTSTGRWCQIGRVVHLVWLVSAAGTTNATSITITMPCKADRNSNAASPKTLNASISNIGITKTVADSAILTGYPTAAEGVWTNPTSAYFNVNQTIGVGPDASFDV